MDDLLLAKATALKQWQNASASITYFTTVITTNSSLALI